MSELIKASANRITKFEEGGGQLAPPVQEVPQESLISVLWRGRWIVAICTILGIAAGFAYVFTATPIYTSTSRLYIEQAGPKILNDGMGVQRQSDSYLYTQAQLFSSTPIVAAAIDSLSGKNLKTFVGIDNRVAYLKKAVSVDVGKKDDLLGVSLDSAYPEEAALLVNAVVDSYISYHSSQKRTTASEVLKILTNEKHKRDAELAEKTKAMLDFKTANGALSFQDDKGNIVIQRLARLSDALTEAQLKAADAKATLAAAEALVDNPAKLRELIDADRASKSFNSVSRDEQVRSEMSRLQVQRSILRQTLGDNHRSLNQLDMAIQELRGRMAADDVSFAEAYVDAARQNHEVAIAKAAEIQIAFDTAQKEAMDLNSISSVYGRLQTELNRVEKMCDILDTRIKELNVTEDVGALNISVLEVARPENTPTKPQKTRTLALALVLGAMSGIGLALVRDWTDHRLRSAEEVQASLGVPVLGIVPHILNHETTAERGRVVADDAHSDVAEAYRTIRTTLYFGVPGANPRSILVTSPESADGKTTLVSNLAIAMAQAGQRVLLLDCDFRKPSQATLFGLQQDIGISSVVSGETDVHKVIQATSVAGLDLLGGGPVPANPSEILNSQGFAKLLQKLSEEYDRVVIDSPPVMAVTDARILGAMCDVTVLVLRADKSTRRGARQAMDGLLSVGAQVVGSVINDVVRGRGHYGYGYGYGYGHGYGYGVYGRNGGSKPERQLEASVESEAASKQSV